MNEITIADIVDLFLVVVFGCITLWATGFDVIKASVVLSMFVCCSIWNFWEGLHYNTINRRIH